MEARTQGKERISDEMLDRILGDEDPSELFHGAGAVRGRGLAGPDLPGDRRGDGGVRGVAEPSSAGHLSDRVSGRDPRQGSGRRVGVDAGRVSGDRRRRGGSQERAGDVAGRARGGQVLAQRAERAQGPGSEGHSDRGGGRPEGLSRGPGGGVPPDHGADLHRAPDAPFAVVRVVSRAQGAGGGAEAHLQGGERRAGGGAAGRLRGVRSRTQASGRGALVAQPLGAGDPVPGVLEADPQGDLHHERHREPERVGASGGARAGALHERGRGEEADLPGAARGE